MSQLSDKHLLSLLLRGDLLGEPCIDQLLAVLGSFDRLDTHHERELLRVPGLGRRRLARLYASLELGRRALLRTPAPLTLQSHLDVWEWARPKLVPLEHEELWLLSLDARNGLKSADKVAQGGIAGCGATPRDVLRPAVRNAAAAVVVVHNHPSGDPTPSAEDIQMTEQLAQACAVLGIPLVDHVVVARDGVRSIAELAALEMAC